MNKFITISAATMLATIASVSFAFGDNNVAIQTQGVITGSTTSAGGVGLDLNSDTSLETLSVYQMNFSSFNPSTTGIDGSVVFTDFPFDYGFVANFTTTSAAVNNGTFSGNGVWTYNGDSAGAYTKYAFGSGTFSYSYNPATNNSITTQFVGKLQAAPEPSGIAAMAVGLVGLIARRRK